LAAKRKGKSPDPSQYMKKLYLLAVFICFIGINVNAVSIEPGYFSDKTHSNSILSVSSDYSSGNYSLGYTVNANLSDKNYGLESIVVRYFENDDGTLGIRYAPIEDMSFGYGLLLNDLNTLYYQPPFFQNEHSGLRLYYDYGDFMLESFGTYSHLYGVRIKDYRIFNLNIGIEYLSDTNQTSREGFGRVSSGAHVELPLTDSFSLFCEAANTSNGGEGNIAGVIFDYDLIFAFSRVSIGAASFNSLFVPGYFTSGYDINPVDFSSLEAKGDRRYGTMINLDSGILGLIDLHLSNENYTDGGSATSGSILVTPIDRVNITGYVKELSFLDFRTIKGKDANMVGGSVEYKIVNGMSVSVNYKKTPSLDDLKPYDSAYCKLAYQF
jgi:hypothetical protein